VVGVNRFQVGETLELERLTVDPSIEETQCSRLAELRRSRDSARANELLTRLEQTARTSDNLMPLLIESVENRVTLGEICGVLRGLWGEYQPPAWL